MSFIPPASSPLKPLLDKSTIPPPELSDDELLLPNLRNFDSLPVVKHAIWIYGC
jgi:hypothetical protein